MTPSRPSWGSTRTQQEPNPRRIYSLLRHFSENYKQTAEFGKQMFLYRYCIVCLQFFFKLAGDYIVNKRVFVNKFFVFVTSRDS